MAWTTPTAPATGDVLTATKYTTEVVNNPLALYATAQRIAYTTQSATGTVASTSAAPVNKLFSTGISFTAAAATTYIVETYVPSLVASTTANAYLVLYLCDSTGAVVNINGGTAIGLSPYSDGTRAGTCSHYSRVRWTPGAGAKTLNVGATHAAGAGAIGSTSFTGFATLAVYGPDIT